MFVYKNQTLHCEDISLDVLARRFGTPLYVYSRAQWGKNIQAVKGAFDRACPKGLCCYAVKANSHLAFLRYLSAQGFGFDIVSHGELLRVLQAQGHVRNVVYSGSAKSKEDIYEAARLGIFMLNVESLWEIRKASEAAQALGTDISLALRVNPSVDPCTHKNISTGVRGAKFGIPLDEIPAAAEEAASLKGVNLKGLSCHIGSMVDGVDPYLEMLEALRVLAKDLSPYGLTHWDLGGGFPICYTAEKEIDYNRLFRAYGEASEALGLIPIIEPGRSLAGNTAVLLSKVIHVKESYGERFVFLDAGFTELIRPALYEAKHRILPVEEKGAPKPCTVAGPICESTDVFAEGVSLALEEGSLAALENAGAYGASMASHYNTRPSCPEVLVDGGDARLITEPSGYEALWQREIASPF